MDGSVMVVFCWCLAVCLGVVIFRDAHPKLLWLWDVVAVV